MKKRKVKLFASIASLALVTAVMGVGVWAATQQAVNISSEVKFSATSIAADVSLKVMNKDGATDSTDIVETAWLNANAAQKLNGTSTGYENIEEGDTTTPVNDLTANYLPIGSFTTDTAKGYFDQDAYVTIADKEGDGYLNVGAQFIYSIKIDMAQGSASALYRLTATFQTIQWGGQDLEDIFTLQIVDTTATDNQVSGVTYSVTAGTDAKSATLTNFAADANPDPAVADKIAEQETRIINVILTVKEGAEGYQGISSGFGSAGFIDINLQMANNQTNIDGFDDVTTKHDNPMLSAQD